MEYRYSESFDFLKLRISTKLKINFYYDFMTESIYSIFEN